VSPRVSTYVSTRRQRRERLILAGAVSLAVLATVVRRAMHRRRLATAARDEARLAEKYERYAG